MPKSSLASPVPRAPPGGCPTDCPARSFAAASLRAVRSWVTVVLSLLLGFPAEAGALPGWRAVGPERGAVLDVLVSGDDVYAVSGTGVLKSNRTLARWSRQPRFPENVRRLAAGKDAVVWAITDERAWRLGAQPQSVGLPGSKVVVSAAVGSRGDLLVAVRGEGKGVWRLRPGSEPEQVLAGIDPWTLLFHNSGLWVGTLGSGLRVSHDDGATFETVAEAGEVSVLASVKGELWVGWSDGRVNRGRKNEPVCQLASPPLGIAAVGGVVQVLAEPQNGAVPRLSSCKSGTELSHTEIPRPDGDPNLVEPSGLWSLGDGSALLGDFRRGPMLVDPNGTHLARTDFRATFTSAVASHPDGRVVLVLARTGTYVGDGNGWDPLLPNENNPAFSAGDATDVALDGQRVVIADQAGVTVGRGSTWIRSEGVSLEGGEARNALVELGIGAASQLFARDAKGGLWAGGGRGWEKCATAGALSIEGSGANLVVVTESGALRLTSCSEAARQAWPAIVLTEWQTARTDGHWLATPTALYRDGREWVDAAFGSISAIASRTIAQSEGGSPSPEVLVATTKGSLFRCTEAGCGEATQPLPGQVHTIGWFADGRIFAAESRGTVLVADETGRAPAFTDAAFAYGPSPEPARGATAANLGMPSKWELPPWRGVARANVSIPEAERRLPDTLDLPSGDHRRNDMSAQKVELPPETAKPQGGGPSRVLRAMATAVFVLAVVIAVVELRRDKGRGSQRSRRK